MRQSILTPVRALAVALLLPASLVAQGRIEIDTLHSRALEGNRLGDSPDREVYVYLPPSYDQATTRRYPVLYLLHGMTSHPREWLDGSYQGFDLRVAMDSLAEAGATEYLVVMPYADNAAGGSFYVNSAAYGNWEDLVTGELIPLVDARYRTIAERHARGLAGQSMGGFGALFLIQDHADLFASVYAMSPCCLGFVGELAPESDAWRQPSRWSWMLDPLAAAFAPAERLGTTTVGDKPPLPVGPRPYTIDSLGNRLSDTAAVNAWRGFLPLERLARDPAPFRTLCAIELDAGRQDQITNVPLGTRAFAEVLTLARIQHTFAQHDGGHIDRARERFEQRMLPFFARVFATPGGC
jgi:S-formylglutathione hydrolase FrmB